MEVIVPLPRERTFHHPKGGGGLTNYLAPRRRRQSKPLQNKPLARLPKVSNSPKTTFFGGCNLRASHQNSHSHHKIASDCIPFSHAVSRGIISVFLIEGRAIFGLAGCTASHWLHPTLVDWSIAHATATGYLSSKPCDDKTLEKRSWWIFSQLLNFVSRR